MEIIEKKRGCVLTNIGFMNVDISTMSYDEKKLISKLATNDASLHTYRELKDEDGIYLEKVDDDNLILWENNPYNFYWVRYEDDCILGFDRVEEMEIVGDTGGDE